MVPQKNSWGVSIIREDGGLHTCSLSWQFLLVVSGEGMADGGVCVAGLVGYTMVQGDSGSGNWQLVSVLRLETCLRRSGTIGRLWSAIARAVPS